MFFLLMRLRAGRARLWWAVTAITRHRPTANACFTSARESRRPHQHSTSIRRWHRPHRRVVTPALLQESSRRIWAVGRPTTTLSNEPAQWMCKFTLSINFFFLSIHLKTVCLYTQSNWIALNWSECSPILLPVDEPHSIKTRMRRLPTPLSNPT